MTDLSNSPIKVDGIVSGSAISLSAVAAVLSGAGAGTPCLMEWASSGIAYAHRLNNATQTMTASAGSNTGDWFADTPLRNRFTLGAVAYNNSVISYNAMKVSLVMVADAELSSGDRTALTAWVASYYGLTLS